MVSLFGRGFESHQLHISLCDNGFEPVQASAVIVFSFAYNVILCKNVLIFLSTSALFG